MNKTVNTKSEICRKYANSKTRNEWNGSQTGSLGRQKFVDVENNTPIVK